jgi:hypothetical protein
MKIEFTPDERKVLLARFGLPAKATDADIAAAFARNLQADPPTTKSPAAPRRTPRPALSGRQPTYGGEGYNELRENYEG